jgi:hypothetical protein
MKMRFMKKIIFIACLFSGLGAFAQTGIGTTSPDASARLDVSATNKGFLPPRVALTATNAAGPIPSPATGLLVYNTATAGTSPNNVVPGYYFWNSSSWSYLTNNAVNSMGAISGSSTANGASITGGVLTLAPADGTNGGVLTTGAQTFAGAKTFSGNTTMNGTLTGGNTASSTISGFAANINAQSGTSYTLASTDNGKILNFTNSTAGTITLPSTLPAGFNCMVVQNGGGQLTFTGSGVTVNNRNAFTKSAGQYSIVTILYVSSTVAITSGEMSN